MRILEKSGITEVITKQDHLKSLVEVYRRLNHMECDMKHNDHDMLKQRLHMTKEYVRGITRRLARELIKRR